MEGAKSIEKIIENIFEMLAALNDGENRFNLSSMIIQNLENLENCLEKSSLKEKLKLLKKQMKLYERDLIIYPNYFLEEFIYILNYIEKGAFRSETKKYIR